MNDKMNVHMVRQHGDVIRDKHIPHVKISFRKSSLFFDDDDSEYSLNN